MRMHLHLHLHLILIPILAGCGGGGGDGGTTPPPAGNTTEITALNDYRTACGGTALMAVSEHSSLTLAALKHAGWQARYDALVFPRLRRR